MKPLEHVLIATDFGPASASALQAAIDLAVRFGARLTVLHAVDAPAYAYPFPVPVAVSQAAQSSLDAVVVLARERVPSAQSVLREGVAAEEIALAATDLGADLIVVGSHGRYGLSRMVHGSVAEQVVRLSRVPVLTLRGAGL
jgi:universal stress protein A